MFEKMLRAISFIKTVSFHGEISSWGQMAMYVHVCLPQFISLNMIKIEIYGYVEFSGISELQGDSE